MTNRKDQVEQARADLAKVIRTAIRLKHTLAADAEINDRLPEAEALFNASVQQGELPDPIGILGALDA